MDRPCDKDCFHCPYDDCVLDRMDADDYDNMRRIERDFIAPRSRRREAIAAKKRAYYEANREEIAAKQRAYYEANREEIAGYGLFLKCIRTEKGYTQRELAALCGVAQSTISLWESGKLPPDLGKLLPVLMPTAEKANMEEKKGKKKSAR